MAHIGQKPRFGLARFFGGQTGAGQFGLPLFGFGHVTLDRDPKLDDPLFENRDHRGFNPQQPARFGLVQNLNPQRGMGVDGMSNLVKRRRVGVRRVQDIAGKAANHLVKLIPGDPGKAVVYPFNPARRFADDDAVIGIFGNQRQPLAVTGAVGQQVLRQFLILLMFQQRIFLALSVSVVAFQQPDEQQRDVDQQPKPRRKKPIGARHGIGGLAEVERQHGKGSQHKDAQPNIRCRAKERACQTCVDAGANQKGGSKKPRLVQRNGLPA